METKHTAGPWRIGKVEQPREAKDWTDHGGYRIDAPGVEQLCYVWNASNRMLPESGKQNGPAFGSDEGAANAAVIASAPDMLQLLLDIQAESSWRTDDNTIYPRINELIRRATACDG